MDADMGGELSPNTGDFAQKVLALDSLADRLKLLSREHVDNVDWCDQQVVELAALGTPG
ncbi:MAG: hypothetical protein ACYDCQ_22945 [Dehalococcoidia bacterium]